MRSHSTAEGSAGISYRLPERTRAAVTLVLAGTSLPLGIYGEWSFSHAGASTPSVLYDLAVGWVFVAAGLIASFRASDSGAGLLMVAEGFTWFLTNLEGSDVGALDFAGSALTVLNEAVFVHLLLAFPSGRLRSGAERAIIVAVYGIALVGGLSHVGTPRIPYDPYRCQTCTPGVVLLAGHEGLLVAVQTVCEVLATLLGLTVTALIVRRWARSTAAGRRRLAPVALSLGSCVLLVGEHLVAVFQFEPSAPTAVGFTWASDILQLAVPLGFLAVAVRMRMARAAIGELVLELGPDLSLDTLQSGLVRALGDPSIRVALWDQDSSTYRDGSDRLVPLPAAGDPSVARQVAIDGRPIAVVVHDRALDDDPGLVRAAERALRLGAERTQMDSRLREQLAEVRASRARIAAAAEAERRRLERDLHDGAQQRLVMLSMTLASALRHLGTEPDTSVVRDRLAEAVDELRHGLRELRELARGIHPAILSERGLAGAAESLAARMPIPVEVSVAVDRCPPALEASAYFVLCEALTNVAKHARASRAWVSVARASGHLVVEVMDDGVGGASAGEGSGLHGLADRVAAAGGALSVHSPAGAGTRIRATLPCD